MASSKFRRGPKQHRMAKPPSTVKMPVVNTADLFESFSNPKRMTELMMPADARGISRFEAWTIRLTVPYSVGESTRV